MSVPLFISLLSFIKFTGPTDADKKDWTNLSNTLKIRLAPLHQEIGLATDRAHVEALGDRLSLDIRTFFVENNDFFEDEAARAPSSKFIHHNNSTITQLEDLKKKLRLEAFGDNGTEAKRKEFYECLQAISELKKKEKRKQENKSTLYQEKQK